ncbi:MAG: hypothetical protein ACK5SI_14520 [Planctomycetia bacterium]|jgi:hypothetical protein
MPDSLSDQRFLAIRSLIVELAAALDRVERHAGADGPAGDARWHLLAAAVERLTRGGHRVDDIQGLFSDTYDPGWRADGGPRLAGSPNCCDR